jgi:hypothetical protein
MGLRNFRLAALDSRAFEHRLEQNRWPKFVRSWSRH